MAVEDYIQQRVERSIFEVLRKAILAKGYIPDISNGTRYPTGVGGKMTQTAMDHWQTDLAAVIADKGWAVEIFGTSDSFAKGERRAPRIVIVPQRIMPGDIGFAPGLGTISDPEHEGGYLNIAFPDTSANMHYDIHLVSSSQAQSRFMNFILSTVLGKRKYIYFEDDNTDNFFIRHYNYYNVSDTNDGIEENVYTYEVPDLYIFPDSVPIPIVPIIEIDTNIILGYETPLADSEPNGGDNVIFTVRGGLVVVDMDVNRIIMGEQVSGLLDGDNKVFTTLYDFEPGKIAVYLNGQLQKPGLFFNESSTIHNRIILIDAPLPTDEILVDYIKFLN